jgi:Ssp1 endopeptidase immunity protein Rap1a
MKRLIVFLLLAFSCGPTYAVSVKDLLNMCEAPENETSIGFAFCTAFIMASRENSTSFALGYARRVDIERGYRSPNDERIKQTAKNDAAVYYGCTEEKTNRQLRATFISWARENRNYWDQIAQIGFHQAMRESYPPPC